MKIRIELDVPPEEVGLAAELLQTLRLLTDRVQGAAPPVVRNVREIIDSLLNRLADTAQLEAVSAELAAVLSNPAYGDPAEVTDHLLQSFLNIVLNVDAQQQSVVPYMYILPTLTDPFKSKVRDGLIQKVMAHLSKKRPVNADRTTFFAHAEAFAMLVQLEFVGIDGAAQTMSKLLSKPDLRCAGVSMLGKTAEYCPEKLLFSCTPERLNGLYEALAKVTEDVFVYDMDFIQKALASARESHPHAASGQAPATPGVMDSAAPPAAPLSLHALDSYMGHTKKIYAICRDPINNALVSGGQDGQVLIWGNTGEVLHRIDLPEHYICAMDVAPRSGLLLLCGISSEPHDSALQPSSPVIALYSCHHGWQPAGVVQRISTTVVSCVRALAPEVDGFVTGESFSSGPTDYHELVCIYDLSRAGGAPSELQPVSVFSEHTELVTCVTTSNTDPNMVVSGSRDKTVRLWDRRLDKSVGMLGMAESVGGLVEAHQQLVTSVDLVGNILLTSSVDAQLGAWDLRHLSGGGAGAPPLSRQPVDNQPLMKVALTGSPNPYVAAVASNQSLFLVDLTNAAQPICTPASPFQDARSLQQYPDIKWGANSPYLYAAGDSMRIDRFAAS